MPTGVVKWFDEKKGYGFITPDGGDGTNDIFAHYSAIVASGPGRRNLYENQHVEYDVTRTEKGYQAENIRALD